MSDEIDIEYHYDDSPNDFDAADLPHQNIGDERPRRRPKSSQKTSSRAKFHEIENREIKKVSQSKKSYYINGDDDLYPSRVERIIRQSPTAKRAATMMAKYIHGKGVKGGDSVIINKKKNITLNKFIKDASQSLSYQGGVFIHISYILDVVKKEFSVSDLTVLNYKDVRVGFIDDNDYVANYTVKNRENEDLGFGQSKISEKNYYSFNLNYDVIMAQIKKDWEDAQKSKKNKTDFNLADAVKNYSGQVYYLNMTFGEIYALSYVDAAMKDADTEARISTYNNIQAIEGYMGSVVVVTQGMKEEDEEDFGDQLELTYGVDNSTGVLHYPVRHIPDGQKLEDFLKVIQTKPAFDDKLYTETKKSGRENILGQFNNLPEGLAFSGSGSLFGVSDKAYIEMKKFYSEQTEEERTAIEQMIFDITKERHLIIPIINKSAYDA